MAGEMANIRPSQRKHLMLLVFLILLPLIQPLIEREHMVTRIISDALLIGVCLYICYIILGSYRERLVGLTLFALVLLSNVAHYAFPSFERAVSVVFRACLIAFLGVAVAVILRNLFHKTVIRGDDIVGAICGYMLGALLWANLYTLAYRFVPGAFTVNEAILKQVEDWQLKRSLFDYLSFTTLTSLGYGDITPVGQPAFSLTWLEVLFGQFYMAVVVAQMVGLKLAQAIKARGQDST